MDLEVVMASLLVFPTALILFMSLCSQGFHNYTCLYSSMYNEISLGEFLNQVLGI